MNPWARAIKRRLNAWNWTQRQLAHALGVSEARVSTWVHGQHEPAEEMKVELVKLMGITAAEVAPAWLKDATVPSMPGPPDNDPAEAVA